MNKVLFVDDDPIIARTYVKRIDWRKLGVDAVYTALSGEEAQALIRKNMPGVVVCDIEMGKLSGIDLARWVQEQGFTIKFIFLSAYDNFSYAQAAVKLGCVDYLLKPAPAEEVSAAIEDAIDELNRELCREESAVFADYWMQNRAVVYEKYWYDLLTEQGGRRDSESCIEQGEKLGMDFAGIEYAALFLYCIQNRPGSPASAYRSRTREMQELAARYFTQQTARSYSCRIGENLCASIVLYGSRAEAETSVVHCGRLIRLFRDEMTVPLVIVQDTADQPGKCPDLLKALKIQLTASSRDLQEKYASLPLVDRIRYYIAENVESDINKESVGKYVSMNADYASRLFKKETGLSVQEFITLQKMHRARRLLLETDEPIGSIAAAVGFTNFSYFTKVFYRQFGCTPKDYRRAHAGTDG